MTTGGTGGKPKPAVIEKTIFDDARAAVAKALSPEPEYDAPQYVAPEPQYTPEPVTELDAIKERYLETARGLKLFEALAYRGGFRYIVGGKATLAYWERWINGKLNNIEGILRDAGFVASTLDNKLPEIELPKNHKDRLKIANLLRAFDVHIEVRETPKEEEEILTPYGYTAFWGADHPLREDGGVYVTLLLSPKKGKPQTTRVFVPTRDGLLIGYQTANFEGEQARYIVAIRNTSELMQSITQYAEKNKLKPIIYAETPLAPEPAYVAPEPQYTPEPEPANEAPTVPDGYDVLEGRFVEVFDKYPPVKNNMELRFRKRNGGLDVQEFALLPDTMIV